MVKKLGKLVEVALQWFLKVGAGVDNGHLHVQTVVGRNTHSGTIKTRKCVGALAALHRFLYAASRDWII